MIEIVNCGRLPGRRWSLAGRPPCLSPMSGQSTVGPAVGAASPDRPAPPRTADAEALDETVKIARLEGVDTAGLILTAVGSVAGVFGAYFAWVAVRRARPKAKKASSAKPTADQHPGEERSKAHAYDVFVSYSHDDRDWVAGFAGRLEAAGLRVARDEVFLRPGDVLVHAIEQAILESAHGVLVFSQASVADGWVSEQYAAMMQKTIEDGRRFIPVVIDDVELPVFAASRYYIDFQNVSYDDYDQLITKIIDALRGADDRRAQGAN